ncbi:MAG TPA: hypothetical protein VFM28_08495 [Nitrososphaeraceae archaeon]|jgi:hypothetical protein|nr:hypothetical protein [Nitrososphaeraceae archaeon]
MLHPKLKNKETQVDEMEKEELKSKINYNNYTLKYLYNTNNTFFKLFMHTKVYDKTTNENIEKQGILLRSWNPITKNGERYIFNMEDGEGDLNTKSVYFPDAKTIIEISNKTENEDISKLAKEIIDICPHKDIEIKYIN